MSEISQDSGGGRFGPGGEPPGGTGSLPNPLSDGRSDRLLALLAYIGSFAMPLVVTLAIYLTMRDHSPFVRLHASRAFNIQATTLIYELASITLMAIAADTQPAISLLFLLILILAGAIMSALTIRCAIDAAKGSTEPYRPRLPIPILQMLRL